MKRFLVTALLGLFAFSAIAADLEMVRLAVSGVATSQTDSTDTSVLLRGKIVAMAITPSTNMALQVTTASGYGQSVGAAKVVLPYTTNVTAISGIQTNPVATHYLFDDKLVLSAKLCVYTGTAETATAYILLEK